MFSARSLQKGFTLVEIMAVVFIIGVMVAMVSVRVGGGPERELHLESQKLYQKIRLLAEEAEYSGVEVGLNLTDEGYELYRFSDASLKWVPFTEGGYGPVTLESDYELQLKAEGDVLDTSLLFEKERREKSRDYGEKKKDEPEIMFFSDGQLTPFELTIKNKNIPKASYTVKGENPAKLSIEKNGK